MMIEDLPFFSRKRRVAAWMVHLFTASGAVFGLGALWAMHLEAYVAAFWLMGVTIIIDSVDGIFARRAQTKYAAPKVDGALLDNMVDYFTYALVPAFFLLVTDLLPPIWSFVGASVVVLISAYWFTQPNAKTPDHFFQGFPCYWNIIVFYLYLWQLPPWANLFIIFILVLLVFVPIKYVYPSRLDYLTSNRWLRIGVLMVTLLWGGATAGLLFLYPDTNPLLVGISLGYAVFYTLLSIYRTLVPVDMELLDSQDYLPTK